MRKLCPLLFQTGDAGGLWYRKHLTEAVKSKKRMRDKKQPADKPVEGFGEKHRPHKEEAAKKVSPNEIGPQ